MRGREPAVPADGSVIEREHARAETIALPTHSCGAVIVPAHNESAVIARTLTALAPLAAVDGVEVIVACNGCDDDTAEIARHFRGVCVVETSQASKTAAMNLGDAAAGAWPRLYLDADIDIAPATVLAVFAALAEPGVLAARAPYVYDTRGASGPVRAYYRARSRIPAPPLRLWGAGGYAASEAGHGRFGRFPVVTADDSWFDEQFAPHEKRVVVAAPMRVRTPLRTDALLAVLARQRRGYREIGIAATTRTRGTALLGAIRGPRSAIDVGWYVVLTLASRRRAAAALRRSVRVWERDGSSRIGGLASR